MTGLVPNLEPLARGLAAICAVSLALGVALFVLFAGARELRAWTPAKGIAGRAWQGLLSSVILVGFVAAGFGVGKFFELYTEGWEAIASMLGILFGGWLGFRGWKLKTSKGADVDTTGATTDREEDSP